MPHVTQYRSFWRQNHPREATQDAEHRPQTLEYAGLLRNIIDVLGIWNWCIQLFHNRTCHWLSFRTIKRRIFRCYSTAPRSSVVFLHALSSFYMVLALTSLLTLWCVCCCMV